MAGRLGVETLAAVAIGGSLWFFAFTIGLGLLMAIAPIAARHYGAGDAHLIGRYTRQGIYLGIALAIPVIFAAQYLVGPLLVFIPIDPGFREMTIGYTQAITLGAPGMFVFLALRFTTEGIGVTKPIMYISFFAIVCNVFLNWVLIFGNLGAPELGAVGCGIASAITMWLMAIIMAVYMVSARRYKVIGIFSRRAPPRDFFAWLADCCHDYSRGRAVQCRIDPDGNAGRRDNGGASDCDQFCIDDVYDSIGIELGDHRTGWP